MMELINKLMGYISIQTLGKNIIKSIAIAYVYILISIKFVSMIMTYVSDISGLTNSIEHYKTNTYSNIFNYFDKPVATSIQNPEPIAQDEQLSIPTEIVKEKFPCISLINQTIHNSLLTKENDDNKNLSTISLLNKKIGIHSKKHKKHTKEKSKKHKISTNTDIIPV